MEERGSPNDADQSGVTEHVVLIVPGIRDVGAWQGRVEQELTAAGLIPYPVKYGFYPVWSFLWPWVISDARDPEYQSLLVQYQSSVEKHSNARISVVAHSYGTYLVGRLLQESNASLFRIILCGSVLPQNFPWHEVRQRFGVPQSSETFVLNECGSADAWPVWAATALRRYGQAGRDGFSSVHTQSRWYAGDHGCFLKSDHVRQNWVPFLTSGRLPIGNSQQPRTHLLERIRKSVPGAGIFAFLVVLLIEATNLALGAIAVFVALFLGYFVLSSTIWKPSAPPDHPPAPAVKAETKLELLQKRIQQLRPEAKQLQPQLKWSGTSITASNFLSSESHVLSELADCLRDTDELERNFGQQDAPIHLTVVNFGGESMSLFSGVPILDLVISECSNLRRLWEGVSPARLRSIEISGCKHFVLLSDLSGLESLTCLRLNNCDSITSLQGLHSLDALQQIHIESCNSFNALDPSPPPVGKTIIAGSRSIFGRTKVLVIRACPLLDGLNGIDRFPAITTLDLSACEGLSNLKGVENLTQLEELAIEKNPKLNARVLAELATLAAMKRIFVGANDDGRRISADLINARVTGPEIMKDHHDNHLKWDQCVIAK